MSVEAGQIRRHRRTGLTVEVISRRPQARTPSWMIRYVNAGSASPRIMSERSLIEYYPPARSSDGGEQDG